MVHGTVEFHNPLEFFLLIKPAFACPEILCHLDRKPDGFLDVNNMTRSGGATRNNGLGRDRHANHRGQGRHAWLHYAVEMV